MPVSAWTVIWASTQPVVKVILLCGVGVVCTRKGILDYQGRKTISSLAYLVFIPALNFVSLGSTLTPHRLLIWWPLIINVLLSHLLGAVVGCAIVKLIHHDHWFRRHVIAAVMFGNTGNLPLVIVSTLAQTSAEILGGIDPAQAQGLAVSYIMVGLLVSVLFAPTIGFRLLAKQPDLPEVTSYVKGASQEPSGASAGAGKEKQAAPAGDEDKIWLLSDAGSRSDSMAGGKAEVNGGQGAGGGGGVVQPGAAWQGTLAVQPEGNGEAVPHLPGPEGGLLGPPGSAGGGVARPAVTAFVQTPAQQQAEAAETGAGAAGGGSRAEPRLATIGDNEAGAQPVAQPQLRHQEEQEAEERRSSGGGSSRPRNGAGPSRLGVGSGTAWDSEPPGGQQQQDSSGPAAVTVKREGAGLDEQVAGAGQGQGEPQPLTAELSAAAWSSKPKWMLSRYTPEFLSFRKPSSSQLQLSSSQSVAAWAVDHPPPGSMLPSGSTRAPIGPTPSMRNPGQLVPTPPLLPSLLGRKRSAAFVARSRDVVLLGLHEILSPPILSTLLAIFVGCIHPVQKLFFGPDAPLSLLTDCLTMLSSCVIPAIMISLGATLANGPGAAKVPLRTLLSVSLCRLVLLPLLGIVIVLGGYTSGAFHAPDAIFILVMLLQNTAPTAILVHTMSAVHQNYDSQVSTLLFWQYLISIVTVPPYIALFLWAVGLTYHAD